MFWLCSGDDATLNNGQSQFNYDIHYNGTAICMDIDTTRLTDNEKILPDIARAGELKATQYGGSRVLTASKVSSIASLVHKINQ